MPRSHRHRRQEIRARRRRVRRSLNLFRLDDDPNLLEEDAAEPLPEVASRRHGQDQLLWLARDIAQDE
jgi:hypothetical protein